MNRVKKRAFLDGMRDCSPFVLVIVPFGLLFGVVASEAGLNILETLAMTILVIAGASQFTALALLSEQAPTLVVIAAALAVNLRMAMYSAALVPHLGKASLRTRALAAYFMVDQSFAVAIKKYQAEKDYSLSQKLAYYFGCAAIICPFWYGCSAIGALLGQTIPKEYSLDFAIPICFIALVAPMLRSVPHLIAALVSVVCALVFAWMPYNLWLIVAAFVAMAAGAQAELWVEARRAQP